jgi:DNA-3-methyladenine glycosylase II
MADGPADLDIASGLAHLAATDPDMAAAINRVGAPEQRRREPGFSALVNIVVSQQVSLQSAAAIWGRLNENGPVTADTILALGEDGLRAVGFSRPKVRYCLSLAQAVASKSFKPASLAEMDDEGAMAAVTGLLGFGRWSGEIYLMFCLGRPDVWPAGDIALQEATRAVKGLNSRPGPGAMDQIAEAWRPWRSVAAHLLWRYYRDVIKAGTTNAVDGFQ